MSGPPPATSPRADLDLGDPPARSGQAQDQHHCGGLARGGLVMEHALGGHPLVGRDRRGDAHPCHELLRQRDGRTCGEHVHGGFRHRLRVEHLDAEALDSQSLCREVRQQAGVRHMRRRSGRLHGGEAGRVTAGDRRDPCGGERHSGRDRVGRGPFDHVTGPGLGSGRRLPVRGRLPGIDAVIGGGSGFGIGCHACWQPGLALPQAQHGDHAHGADAEHERDDRRPEQRSRPPATGSMP